MAFSDYFEYSLGILDTLPRNIHTIVNAGLIIFTAGLFLHLLKKARDIEGFSGKNFVEFIAIAALMMFINTGLGVVLAFAPLLYRALNKMSLAGAEHGFKGKLKEGFPTIYASGEVIVTGAKRTKNFFKKREKSEDKIAKSGKEIAEAIELTGDELPQLEESLAEITDAMNQDEIIISRIKNAEESLTTALEKKQLDFLFKSWKYQTGNITFMQTNLINLINHTKTALKHSKILIGATLSLDRKAEESLKENEKGILSAEAKSTLQETTNKIEKQLKEIEEEIKIEKTEEKKAEAAEKTEEKIISQLGKTYSELMNTENKFDIETFLKVRTAMQKYFEQFQASLPRTKDLVNALSELIIIGEKIEEQTEKVEVELERVEEAIAPSEEGKHIEKENMTVEEIIKSAKSQLNELLLNSGKSTDTLAQKLPSLIELINKNNSKLDELRGEAKIQAEQIQKAAA